MLIRDLMLSDPVTATPDARLPHLVRLLQRHGFRHVPIVEGGKLLGIISDRDIKQSMTSAALAADGPRRERLLDRGDPTPVLKWVRKETEDEIRDSFQQAMAVRAKGADAKALADRHFFETLVRIHRAGEGEAFTGLKPHDSVDPGIAAADHALVSGSAKDLATHLSAAVSEQLQKRFAATLERSKHTAVSAEAGREYVEAYVDYVHFVESVHRLVSHGASRKHHEPTPSAEK